MTTESLEVLNRRARTHALAGRGRISIGTSLLVLGAVAYVTARLLIVDPSSIGAGQDEVFSIQVASGSWTHLFATIRADIVHPPLYYILLKLWMAVGGQSLIWLRLGSELCAALVLVPVLRLARGLRLPPVASAVILGILAPNMYLLAYAVDIRMYALLLLVSAWSVVWWRRALDAPAERHPWLVLSLVNVVLIFTHYYGWLLIGAEGLAVLLVRRRALVPMVRSVVYCAVAFAPWAAFVAPVLRQHGLHQNLAWLGRPGLGDVASFIVSMIGELPVPHATTVGVLLIVALFFVALRYRRRSSTAGWPDRLAMFILAFAPMAVALAASYLLPQAVWSGRYLIGVAVPLDVALVAALWTQPYLRVRWTGAAIVLVWAWAAGITARWIPDTGVPQWNAVAGIIEADARRQLGLPLSVYTVEPWAATPLAYGLSLLAPKNTTVLLVAPAALSRLPPGRAWIVYRSYTWRSSTSPEALIRAAGCHPGGVVRLGVIGFPVTCPIQQPAPQPAADPATPNSAAGNY